MARRSAKLPRFSRALVISRRSAAASGFTITLFAASALDGRADLQVAIANGAVQTVTPKSNRDWEWFDYATGPANALSGGFGWNGIASLSAPFLTRLSDELFDSYAAGVAVDLNAGTGWSSPAQLSPAYVTRAALELFDSYPDGAANAAVLTAGSGWSGAPVINVY